MAGKVRVSIPQSETAAKENNAAPEQSEIESAQDYQLPELFAAPSAPLPPDDGQRRKYIQRYAAQFGNQRTLQLIASMGSVQRIPHPKQHLVAVPGVIDNGVLDQDTRIRTPSGWQVLPAETYVEVYGMSSNMMHVRIYSGYGGMEADIDNRGFRQTRQRMGAERDRPVDGADTARENILPMPRPGEPVLDNGYLYIDETHPTINVQMLMTMGEPPNVTYEVVSTEAISQGTYVEVLANEGATLRIRLHSGSQGAMARVAADAFHHAPQIADAERRRVPQVGTPDQNAMYMQNASPLWDATAGPRVTDINQGTIGDCYLLAAAASVVNANPAEIREIFSNPTNLNATSYQVRLYRRVPSLGDHPIEWWPLIRQTYTVHPVQPVNRRTLEPLYASGQVLWGPLLEQAYAELARGYDNMNGSPAAIALEALTGRYTNTNHVPGSGNTANLMAQPDATLLTTLRNLLASQTPIVADTPEARDGGDWQSQRLRIFADHGYSVLEVTADDRIRLYNSHGVDQPVRPITTAELKRFFSHLEIGTPRPTPAPVNAPQNAADAQPAGNNPTPNAVMPDAGQLGANGARP